MTYSKIRAAAVLALAMFCLCAFAHAEVVQRGNLRVNFQGKLTPHSLPRTSATNVQVSVAAKISSSGCGKGQTAADVDRHQPLRSHRSEGPAGLPPRGNPARHEWDRAGSLQPVPGRQRHLRGQRAVRRSGSLSRAGEALCIQRRAGRQAGDPRPCLRQPAQAPRPTPSPSSSPEQRGPTERSSEL